MIFDKPPSTRSASFQSRILSGRTEIASLWNDRDRRAWIIGLVCLLFLGGVWYRWSANAHRASRIEQVLIADSRTSANVVSVAEIVKRMRAISLAGCPTDFIQAYVAHIHAWEEAAALEQEAAAYQSRFNSGAAFVEAFVRGFVFDYGMIGEAATEQTRLRNKYSEVVSRIRSSFEPVESTALRYGATLPPRNDGNVK